MKNNPRHYHFLDHALSGLQSALQTLLPARQVEGRTTPGQELSAELSPKEQRESASLMRVNHTGEVCAQALYIGQSLTTRNPELRQVFQQAAQEEKDHLKWCAERLQELNSRTSYLNPLWFTGSLLIGTCAGLLGDRWSLGFLAETERQVGAHLDSHLSRLSCADHKSRAIVWQMREEETQHANTAISHGAYDLPEVVKTVMIGMSKVMVSVVYFV